MYRKQYQHSRKACPHKIGFQVILCVESRLLVYYRHKYQHKSLFPQSHRQEYYPYLNVYSLYHFLLLLFPPTSYTPPRQDIVLVSVPVICSLFILHFFSERLAHTVNFFDKLRLSWQIQFVLTCEYCCIIFRQGHSYRCIIFACSKQDPYGRILIRKFFASVIIVYIHLQLSQILMRQLFGLQFNYYETMKQTVVKHKICKELVIFQQDTFLPCHKSKTVPHLTSRKSAKCDMMACSKSLS